VTPSVGGSERVGWTAWLFSWVFSWKVALGLGVMTLGLLVAAYIYRRVEDSPAARFRTNPSSLASEAAPPEDATVLLFHATWCPACKVAKPHWESTKLELDNRTVNNTRVRFQEVDCSEDTDDNAELSKRYKIEGYPTVILVQGSKVVQLESSPTQSTLRHFLTSEVLPS
jgi:thiol-disulfide isomerase/thioredoxin